MPFKWSLNPYKGCVHSCHYCYARRYHNFLDLDAGRDFESVIFIKANLPHVLRQELRRTSWVGDEVAIGTATDPYQPIEGRYRLTRLCLEAFADHSNPVTLVTKGTLIVRDVDVLSDLAGRGGCTVCFSITTLDKKRWLQLEPGTPPPDQRLRAMEKLAASGVRAGVLLAPVIPGITDDMANLESVVRSAADHGAQFLGTRILYLQPGTREHFQNFLKAEYPTLLQEYQRLFPGSYAPKKFQEGIRESVRMFKELHELQDQPVQPPSVLQQLSLEV